MTVGVAFLVYPNSLTIAAIWMIGSGGYFNLFAVEIIFKICFHIYYYYKISSILSFFIVVFDVHHWFLSNFASSWVNARWGHQ